MTDLYPIISQHEFFQEFSEDDLATVVGCAANVVFHEGESIFRENEAADKFYLIRHGQVALQVYSPGKGGIIVQTVGEGEPLGWSWLIPPYKWHFEAKCMSLVRAISLDGVCIRNKCEQNPRLGYHLMSRIASMMETRLQASIIQILDLYGNPSRPQ